MSYENGSDPAAIHEEITKLRGMISELQTQVTGMESSLSWQVTRPLRATGALLLKVSPKRGPLASFTSLLTAVWRIGGPIQALKLAKELVQSSGFTKTVKMARLASQVNRPGVQIQYEDWASKFLDLSKRDLNQLKKRTQSMENPPLISVLMPTYNSDPEFLARAISSVRNQIYQNWELCIADDASTDERCREQIRLAAGDDSRIKFVFRHENGHISKATNSCLDLASGDYVSFLDHDDELTVDALAVMALTAVANPDACFFYSDEDKIDAFGVRSEPHFKPDLNRTLALACNYFCHLSMYKSETVNQVGLFESEYDGAQDYDFALRMLSALDDSQVIHVPYVLYHWRTLPNSTSSDSQAKPYALAASRGAVARYLEREGINAKVIPEPKLPFFNRVTPDLIERPMISIIIPTRDKSRVLAKCIDSVLTKTTYSPFEIIIVDNESQETETIEYFESLTDPRIRILKYPHPFNYSAINNFAVSKANGSYICLLNNDTEVLANDWLEQMLGYAQLPRTGAVGAKLLFPDGRLQHGGVILGLGGLSGVAGHAHRLLGQDCSGYMARASLAQEFSAVTAACLMVSKQKFLEAGGLSEELTVAFNDVDFCLKLLDVGYKNIWTPHAQLLHYESYSRGLDTQEQQVQRAAKEVLYMRDKWAYLIDNDPAYNRHLTRNHDDFTLAWPPRKPPSSI